MEKTDFLYAGPEGLAQAQGVVPDAAPGDGPVRRAIWATAVLFFGLGGLSGAWGVHIVSVKAVYALDEWRLSWVLVAAAAGATGSLWFAGRLIARLGTRRSALLCVALLGAALALALHWGAYPVLLAAMLLFGAAMSVYDMAINTEAAALEQVSGQPIMGRMHGCFSMGAMVGAAVCGAMLRQGWQPGLQLLLVAAVVVAAAWAALRCWLARHAPQGSAAAQAHFAWPSGPLLVIGLLIFAGMGAEGAMYDWSVLYLQQEVGLPQAQAAWGYAAFVGAMAAMRFAGDSLRRRWAEHDLLAASGAVAALAMALVLLTAHPWVAFVGYALVGAGLAMVVPLLYVAASRVPGTSPAAAIAAASSIGYCGFLVGPPLIGAVAHRWGLDAALWLVVLSAAWLVVMAQRARSA
ncbi:MAG: MFS transporter [Rhodoferax sp.]